jgi:hypothetical protein
MAIERTPTIRELSDRIQRTHDADEAVRLSAQLQQAVRIHGEHCFEQRTLILEQGATVETYVVADRCVTVVAPKRGTFVTEGQSGTRIEQIITKVSGDPEAQAVIQHERIVDEVRKGRHLHP